jgi:hypothetical protein
MENYTQRIVEKGWFGVRYLYLNDNTRIRYGYSIQALGVCYTLQRYRGFYWQRVSWAYGTIIETLDQLIAYLFYEEDEYEKNKPKSLF